MQRNTAKIDVDVVIIGGGLSGLAAAYQLSKKDDSLTYAIIEAKNRVGGRTIGQELKSANGFDAWDLGGQWVGECQTHIMALLRELNIECYSQYLTGTKVMQLGSNKISHYQSDIPSLSILSLLDLHFFLRKVEKMVAQIDPLDPLRCKHALEWDSMTFKTFIDQTVWTKATKESIEAANRTIFGAEVHQMSLLYNLMYAAAAGGMEPLISAKPGLGGQELKIKGGAFNICEKLKEKVGPENIHTGAPVFSVTQTTDGVEIETVQGDSFTCKKVIFATPPSETVRVNFRPPLPIEKQLVMSRMPKGCLTKIIVTYQTPFWKDKGLSGEVVTNGGQAPIPGASRGPLCVVFDATLPNGSPALVSFIGGDQQVEYAGQPSHMRKVAVLRSLAEYFGDEALDCLDYAEKNWNEEPYNGGCPVCMGTPGIATRIAPALREPFNKIHFAGTESATVWCGFLNGAVQAGYRAANEVLYNLRPQSISSSELEGTWYAPKRTPPEEKRKVYHVLRWTVGLGAIFVAVAVGKKAYFRIAL